jgi:hypothetical protein
MEIGLKGKESRKPTDKGKKAELNKGTRRENK